MHTSNSLDTNVPNMAVGVVVEQRTVVAAKHIVTNPIKVKGSVKGKTFVRFEGRLEIAGSPGKSKGRLVRLKVKVTEYPKVKRVKVELIKLIGTGF